jgi:hypothetical protein
MSYWIAGATVVSTAFSFISGSSAKKAQKKAQAEQLAWEREKLRIADEYRKEDIDRAFGGQEDVYRQQVRRDNEAADGYRSQGFNGSRVADAINNLKPAVAGATNTINDIFNGNLYNRQLSDLQSVNQARTDLGEAMGNGLDEATNRAIGSLIAKAGAKGYVGGSTSDRNAILKARSSGLAGAATARGQANVTNKEALFELTNEDINRAINNLSTPFTFTENVGKQTIQPYATDAGILSARMAPLSSFRLNQPAPSLGSMDFKAIPGNGALIGAAGQGIAQGMSTYGGQKMQSADNAAMRANNLEVARIQSGNTGGGTVPAFNSGGGAESLNSLKF